MGLFDIFSNDDAEQAAQQRNAGLQQGYGQLSSLYDQGRGALTAGTQGASNLYAGLGNYFTTNYGPGAQAYGDATGANGADGYTRAQTNFQTDPGYQFQLGQGLQALQRTHAAAGNLNSGNADTDTLKYATGLADQSYGNYVSRLAPYLNLSAQGQTAAAQGGANTSLYQGLGLDKSFEGQGTAANATQTGIGSSNAAATLNNYNVSANGLNAIMQGAKTAAGLFGAFA